jgi:hypothetical protein
MPKSPVSFAIRTDILKEIMLDKVYAEKLAKAKQFYEVVEVVREFASKKGIKFAEIYIQQST